MELLSRDSLRIVHVDDDDDFAVLGERCLTRAGFKRPIVRCTDGSVALDYLSTLQADDAPHVILVDLHMPRINGLGVLHWIRTKYRDRNVAVYLLTSSEDPKVIHRFAEHGVTAYVPKQCVFDQLIEILDQLIATNNDCHAAQAVRASLRSPTPGLMTSSD